MYQLGKIIIDNRSDVKPFYDDVSMGGGISENTLLRGAGCAQMRSGTSSGSFNNCWGDAPYGDDPEDQYYISLGIEYAKSKGY